MKRLPFLVAALALALGTAPAPGPAHATSTTLQKCRSADGSIGYTDGSCRVFGPDSVTVSSRVLETPDDTLVSGYPEMESGLDGSLQASGLAMGSAAGRRSPADGCARTPTQLAMDLRASLALGDVNRVAESYDWAGMSNSEGQRTLDRLQALVGRPVVDSRFLDASYGAADMFFASAGAAAPSASEGTLQLMLGSGDGPGASNVDFDVHQDSGCYFVSF